LKILQIITGFISLGLGIAGLFLPLLPTTPFILLSAALFAKSSDKFYNKLMNHHLLGGIVRSYKEEKAIPLHAKIYSVALLWGTILFSVIFVLNGKLWLQILLLIIAVGVTIHILRFKTKRKEK